VGGGAVEREDHQTQQLKSFASYQAPGVEGYRTLPTSLRYRTLGSLCLTSETCTHDEMTFPRQGSNTLTRGQWETRPVHAEDAIISLQVHSVLLVIRLFLSTGSAAIFFSSVQRFLLLHWRSSIGMEDQKVADAMHSQHLRCTEFVLCSHL